MPREQDEAWERGRTAWDSAVERARNTTTRVKRLSRKPAVLRESTQSGKKPSSQRELASG
jgi:hypothetical protein